MKQILSVFLVALMMSACQSTSENENTNSPSSISEIPTHNPAHGQPHHDCSLAVGAPLVKKSTPVPSSKVILNPEHGLPGHRCDIAVGAPLT